MSLLTVVILAAGLGKRMKNDLPKVATRTLDGPMILSVISAATALSPEKIVIVTGHKKEIVEDLINAYRCKCKVEFAFQDVQKGTGHAVQCALPNIKDAAGDVLILYGDTPLIKPQTLTTFLLSHEQSGATISILTILSDGTTAYGRIVRNNSGAIVKIQESKDCTPEELAIKEVNSGIYLVKKDFLVRSVSGLQDNNAQKEYYLTDIVEAAVKSNVPLFAHSINDQAEVQGINDFYDLALVNKTIMEERIKELLKAGIRILDPSSVFIDKDVSIGVGTYIGPNVHLKGKTIIGARCIIEGTAYIEDCIIGDDVHLKFSIRMDHSVVKNKASVGPFANIRPETVMEEDVKVGNFVEVKKSILKKGAKVSHLSYIGDSTVGEDVNIGAGTITCNYDGRQKHRTVIEAGVFIGSNTSLVAPVTVHSGATVGAGSVITKDVEANSLTLTRAPLFIKSQWTKKK